ncbi:hypothetical protein [Paraburkholderia sp. ZP32-5]|uniref:hypothetical protein n=1 Tax=Paraburkholderia sp. ZP32-5 TaxID=2883245 RepID=UPI001F2921D7|nr:hypothetical protein [Paraburkholderia sp. ZP32-5]
MRTPSSATVATPSDLQINSMRPWTTNLMQLAWVSTTDRSGTSHSKIEDTRTDHLEAD